MSEQKRMARRNRRHLRRRLVAEGLSLGKGSAVALALGLGLTAGAPAEAAIIYTPLNQTFDNSSLDFLNYLGSPQFTLSHYGYAFYGWARVYGASSSHNAAVNSYGNATVLAKGQRINVNLTWGNSYYGTYLGGNYSYNKYGDWPGKTGYLGLSFDPGDGTHYAWAKLTMPEDAGYLTIDGYAYETQIDTPIDAGQTPLPSSLVLLASGALGLLGFRRLQRRK